MSLGEYLGAGASTTKLLLHLNGNSTDSSGNGIVMTATNNPIYSLDNGKFGQGISFISTSKQSLKNLSTGYGSSTTITCSFWVKWTSTTRGDFLTLRRSDNNTAVQILLNSNNTGGSEAGRIMMNCYVNPTLYIFTSTLATYNDGKWHNIIFILNGSTEYMYIDENYINSKSTGGDAMGLDKIELGGDTINNVNYITTSGDEIIVENRAWTQEEISKYYTMTKGRYATL